MSTIITGTARTVVQAHNVRDVHITAAAPEPSAIPSPSQLPPVPANFTGRSAEIAQLDRFALQSDTARCLAVVIIVGPGGLGKTSLASYWLHSLCSRYDGGALYVDLNGYLPDNAARPTDILSGFLRALGVPPERIPIDIGELAPMFRSVTTGRRVIVLLDNAASAAQVRLLLPGPGPTVRACPRRANRSADDAAKSEGRRRIAMSAICSHSRLDLSASATR
jgi:AAA ATPase-like protein